MKFAFVTGAAFFFALPFLLSGFLGNSIAIVVISWALGILLLLVHQRAV